MNTPTPVSVKNEADGLLLHIAALVVGAACAWASTKLHITVDSGTQSEIAVAVGVAATTAVHYIESRFAAQFAKVGLQ